MKKTISVLTATLLALALAMAFVACHDTPSTWGHHSGGVEEPTYNSGSSSGGGSSSSADGHGGYLRIIDSAPAANRPIFGNPTGTFTATFRAWTYHDEYDSNGGGTGGRVDMTSRCSRYRWFLTDSTGDAAPPHEITPPTGITVTPSADSRSCTVTVDYDVTGGSAGYCTLAVTDYDSPYGTYHIDDQFYRRYSDLTKSLNRRDTEVINY